MEDDRTIDVIPEGDPLPAELKDFEEDVSGRLTTSMLGGDGKTIREDWETKEATFYSILISSGGDLKKALQHSGLTPEAASDLLRTDKFADLFKERVLTAAQARKLHDVDYLDSLAYQVMEGHIKFTREQMDMFKSILRRVGLVDSSRAPGIGGLTIQHAERIEFVAQPEPK